MYDEGKEYNALTEIFRRNFGLRVRHNLLDREAVKLGPQG